MAFAGQKITAAQFNRLQPKKYSAVGTGTLTGPLSNADVTGATITLTTETANAMYTVWCTWDFNMTGASSGTETGRLNLDGANLSPLTTNADPDNGGRGTVPQNYNGTIATPGSHTFKLVASPLTGQQVQNVNCSIIVEITEVV
ncbi:hypothetical protein ABT160_02725 [Streptomyces sp. NPDC001941]|uniref:hypothetical protein n=1 Tax=Streptomyces sp. NPDC001941 TaxID=3154659 RepID=UPI003326831E